MLVPGGVREVSFDHLGTADVAEPAVFLSGAERYRACAHGGSTPGGVYEHVIRLELAVIPDGCEEVANHETVGFALLVDQVAGIDRCRPRGADAVGDVVDDEVRHDAREETARREDDKVRLLHGMRGLRCCCRAEDTRGDGRLAICHHGVASFEEDPLNPAVLAPPLRERGFPADDPSVMQPGAEPHPVLRGSHNLGLGLQERARDL